MINNLLKMKSNRYCLRRQQQTENYSAGTAAVDMKSKSYVVCRTCPSPAIEVNDTRVYSEIQCQICERLHGAGDNHHYQHENGGDKNNNDKDDEKDDSNDLTRGKEPDVRRRCAGHGGIRVNSYESFNNNEQGGNYRNRYTDLKIEPLVMDCCRGQNDVGQWLRTASSVVRWHRVPNDSFYTSKSQPSSDISSTITSPYSTTTTTTRRRRRTTTPTTPSSLNSSIFKLLWILAVVFLTLINVTSSSAQLSPPASTEMSMPAASKGKICQSVDVRNSVSQFSRLEGCRVVEGFVQILLIDHANDSSYANLTFPDLVEITGYLLLYRVNGLRSVGHLFPNLTVIRGHSLFINYALVAFEMMHLQEIGLHSLTNIVRGSVRFEKNPALCYVDTIDWDRITGIGKGSEHVISGNKPKNGCPVCEKHCPKRLTKQDETLCWNRQHCQHVCNPKCGDNACSKSVPGECCHPFCLGGCTGPGAGDCSVCRDVVVAGNRCVNKCPRNTLEFLNRRCVQENECRNMKKPREAFDIDKDFPYKPFNHSCVTECPAGYMDEDIGGKSSCKKCDGLCLKECSGASVDSIASAQKLRGCTHITGSLEIQIRGGKNIVKELEDSLNMIEEIDGYLKIVRSFPLISLNFLKSLRVIHGKTLESAKYSLVVLDNQNLQELWDLESHRAIQIRAKDNPVKVFFHFNPKLCLDTIEKFRKAAGLPEFTELEVAPNSNGDKVACNVTKLRAYVTKKTATAALIAWEAFNHHDPRSLLGYVVYLIEAPNNVTMYDGRDACGGDGWRVDDVSAIDNPEKPAQTNANGNETLSFTHILTQLNPYTQYAFYVKTYTIATERSGAQSDLHYFTTSPDAPSTPRDLEAWSNSSNELVIKWEPPVNKNGNLTHYRIVGRWEKDDRNFLDQRNYCQEPLLLSEKKFPPQAEEGRQKGHEEKSTISTKPGLSDTCLPCKNDDNDQSQVEKEVTSSIAFEDALHNQVYVKRLPNERRRRDLSELYRDPRIYRRDVNSLPEDKENVTEVMENNFYNVFNRTVYGQTTFAMNKLRHFAVYTIEVQACREPVENDTLSNCCSTKSIKTARTLSLDSADDIPRNSFKYDVVKGNNNTQSTTVKLSWEEPPDPNGLIVTYQIEYKNIDVQNVKATVVCIARREYLEQKKTYTLDLASGNYSVKLRATSLAGYGAFTETQYIYIKETNAGGSHAYLVPILIIFGVLIVLLPTGYVLKRKFMPNVPSMRLIATVNPEYVSTIYVPDEWEVPRKKIELLRELGNGSFGMVYEGVARDVVKGKPEVKCAVKTVNENATDRERIEFLNEASVMKAFNTHHVVRLLGVVSQGQPTLVVMELMVNGDLKTYLRSHRPDVCENFSKQPPTLKRILQMAIEIADGMSYLAAKKFVHRDLAARNCMVAEDMTVKIGDFGMTRDIYETDYYRKGTKGLLPVRWMAPESLKDGVFTSYSDVWSYGIVLWEMVTLASQPYQGLSNDQVLRYVIDGGVMERPENCPDSLYTLMRRTWNHKPNQRPTFIDISTMLLSEVNVELFERVSFYHCPEGIEARNQNASHSPQADKDLEMASLHNFRDDDCEGEGSEESPLRQDFGDFASFKPSGPNAIKISSNPIYGATTRNDGLKVSPTYNDFNSSKVPLRADFDDFEGASMESLRSSRDTLDLPFAEDSLKSVKSSPFVEKKTNNSRGNISDNNTVGKNAALSPGSIAKRNFFESPRFSTIKNEDPDYENRTPEVVLTSGEPIKDTNVRRVEFPSIDDVDDKNINEKGENKSKVDYKSKPETLNNGYISGKTTQC